MHCPKNLKFAAGILAASLFWPAQAQLAPVPHPASSASSRAKQPARAPGAAKSPAHRPAPRLHHHAQAREPSKRDDAVLAEEIRKLLAVYAQEHQHGTQDSAAQEPPTQATGNDVVAEARAWMRGKQARPVLGASGLLLYPYGQGQPEVSCAPLLACDIQLQAGEVINNVILGDTVRWIPAPAITGSGDLVLPHVILKPTEAGLTTNLIITTNRRTYAITLKSNDSGEASRIGFYYPAEMVRYWDGQAILAKRKIADAAREKVADLPIASIEQLNLDAYKIEGDQSLPWYPVRVFDDGSHVWIQMPPSIQSSDAPALVLLDKDDHSELVNYRVKQAQQGGRAVLYYIVDKLFQRAALIVGVGNEQQKVEIVRSRGGKSGASWFSHFGG